jgi:hypothetical protein
MSTRPIMPLRLLRRTGAFLLLLAAAACAQPPVTSLVTIPPIPAGEARAWFYRDPGPYDCVDTPYIRMNEAIVGISQIGGASYRDVPPGQYLVRTDNYLGDFNSTRTVYLSPGQQAYFKILCLANWIMGGGGRNDTGFSRETFYVWEIPPEIAQGQVARSQFYGGS